MREVPGLPLWLGHVGDVHDIRSVLAAGVVAVVDLAGNEPAVAFPRDVAYCRFPLLDGGGNPPWLVSAAVGLLRAEVPTLVYCSAGMSRTLVIAAAAVARVRGCPLAEALAFVAGEGPADVSLALLADVEAAEA